MKNGKDILTIEEVLSSLDSPVKREEVFKQLRSSEPQSEELKGIKNFLEANNYDHQKLAAFVSKSEQKFDSIASRSNRQSSSNNWLKVAAVIIPMIGLATFFLLNKPTTDLYANYYEKEAGLPVFMDVGNDKVFNESMNAYKDNDFNDALIGFEGLLQQSLANDTLHYFIACSSMELGNFKDAIEHFKTVNDASVFKEKSEFKMALCLLKLEQFSQVKEVLTEIAEKPTHRYHNKAVELLKESEFN